ncbi:MAG: hypothetical protein IKQ06_04010 [Bacilli bacterium]|nr:hypothetical protein [Bacilli bacterium]
MANFNQRPNLNGNFSSTRFEPYSTEKPKEEEREYIDEKEVPQEVIDKVNNFRPTQGPAIPASSNTSSSNSNSYNYRTANYSTTPTLVTLNGGTTPTNINTNSKVSSPNSTNTFNSSNSSPANPNQAKTCNNPVDINKGGSNSSTSKKDEKNTDTKKEQPKTTPAKSEKTADELLNEYNELKMCVNWRKETSEGTPGYLYNIKYLLKNIENITLEGKLLYEEFIDIEKYKKDVTKAYDELEKIRKDLAESSEKLTYTTGYKTSNSKVFAGATAEKYQQNIIQTEDNFYEMYQKAKDLYDNLATDVKNFEDFNHYLSILKYATLLQMLIEIVNKINNQKTILRGVCRTYTTTKNLPRWWSTKYRKNEKETQYTLVEEKVVNYNAPIMRQIPDPYTFNEQIKTTVYVTETTYLFIKMDDIKMIKKSGSNYSVKVSKNDKPEDYKSAVETLEGRITAAKKQSQIPYAKTTKMIMEVK